MGLIGNIPIFSVPGVRVELIGNDSLSAFVDVDVPHRLFTRLVQLSQCLQRGAAVGLSLQCKPTINLGRVDILAHIAGHAPGHLGKDIVERHRLRCQHPACESQLARLRVLFDKRERIGKIASAGKFGQPSKQGLLKLGNSDTMAEVALYHSAGNGNPVPFTSHLFGLKCVVRFDLWLTR